MPLNQFKIALRRLQQMGSQSHDLLLDILGRAFDSRSSHRHAATTKGADRVAIGAIANPHLHLLEGHRKFRRHNRGKSRGESLTPVRPYRRAPHKETSQCPYTGLALASVPAQHVTPHSSHCLTRYREPGRTHLSHTSHLSPSYREKPPV